MVRLFRLLISLLLVAPPVFADQPPLVSGQSARLSDAPSATFNTSGWSYTSSSNPVILTPDRLTNAMIGVSRLAKGQPLLRSQVTVPEILDVESIRTAISERLKDKTNLSIVVEDFGPRHVVVARYGDGKQESTEYAFEFENHLVHVLLKAKSGAYFDQGVKVAVGIVQSFASP